VLVRAAWVRGFLGRVMIPGPSERRIALERE
jgi:hypothetical protein